MFAKWFWAVALKRMAKRALYGRRYRALRGTGRQSFFVRPTVETFEERVVPAVSLSVNPATILYIEDTPSENYAAPVDATLTITSDQPNLFRAQVSINNYQAGQDVIGYDASLLGSLVASTPSPGSVQFDGVAPRAQYEALINSVTYANTSESPNTLARSIAFLVIEAVTIASDLKFRPLSVQEVNDAPTAANDYYGRTAGGTTTGPTIPANAVYNVAASVGVKANDTDPENQPLAVTKVNATSLTGAPLAATVLSTNGAEVTVFADGSFTYNPSLSGTLRALPVGQELDDTFSYEVTDNGTTAGASDPKTSTATVTVRVTGVNEAPVLAAASPTLATITEDDTANGGQTVASIVGATISDADAGALPGIAVTATTDGNGKWQFALETSPGVFGAWTDFGTVSDSQSLLLRSQDKVRFLPDGKNDTTASVTYRAWDQTSGAAGASSSTATTGGTNPFSTNSNTAGVTVTAVNDAPALTGANDFATITEDDTANTGQKVTDLIAGKVTDVDLPANSLGIVIVGTTATSGVWQYATGGTNWATLPAVSPGSGFVLFADADTRVRFLPDTLNAGGGSITFRAWDRTAPTAALANGSGGVDVTTIGTGGTSPFSAATAAASIITTAVNDAPVVTITPASYSVAEDQPLAVTGISVSDVDSAGADIALTLSVADGTLTAASGGSVVVTGSGTATLTLTGSQSSINAFIASSLVAYQGNANFNGTDLLTATVSDLGNTGGSALTDTHSVNIAVSAVNDAPVVGAPAGTLTVLTGAVLPVVGVTVADVDVAETPVSGTTSGQLLVTLKVLHGTVSLGTTAGLDFVAGFGNGSAEVRFTATQAAANAALATLSYQGGTGYAGADTLTVAADDQGNSGTGGALNATKFITLSVQAGPTVVYVNSAWAGINPGVDPDGVGAGNPATGIGYDAFTTIQSALAAVGAGGTVVVRAGSYTGPFAVNKTVSLVADSGVAVTSPTNQVFTVGAPNVVIQGFAIQVNQRTPSGQRSDPNAAVYGTTFDGLKLLNNTFTTVVTEARAVYLVDGTSSQGVTIQGNTFTGATGTADFYYRTVELFSLKNVVVGGSSPAEGNVFRYGRANELHLNFLGGASTAEVRGNVFNEGGINLTEPGDGTTVVIDGNVFVQGANASQSLFLNHVYSTATVAVTNNHFTTLTSSVVIAASHNVTLDGNTFAVAAGLSTPYAHVIADTQHRAGTQAAPAFQVALSFALTGNTFAGSTTAVGAGVALFNGNGSGPGYGAVTIGGAGALANAFGLTLGQFIQLNNSRNPLFAGPTSETQPTVGAVSGAFDATGNLFDVGSGAALPAGMTATELFSLEDKITHAPDVSGLGLVTVKADNVYVTTASGSVQRGIGAAISGNTVNVGPGTYAENVLLNKSLSLLGPNAVIDPNTGVRVGEAALVPAAVQTSLQGSTSGAVIRVGSSAGPISASVRGFTIDGHNGSLSGGRVLNGVEVHTGAGIVNSIGSFDANPGAYAATLDVQNNVIQNFERYGVLVDNVAARTPAGGNVVSHNKIDNIPSGNNFLGERGRGVAFEENVYGTVAYNVMTRVNVGWQDDNYNLAAPGGVGTVVDHNEIHTYHRGIFHNLQYQGATAATISNNKIYVETSGAFTASATNFGIELSSIQGAVGATVSDNDVTGTVYGILLWNLPTTGSVVVSGGTLTNNQYGVFATSSDPQFGTGAASRSTISGVSVVNPTVAGIAVDTTVAAVPTELAVTSGASVSGGPVGLLLTGANSKLTGNVLGSAAFSGQSGDYIRLTSGAYAGGRVDATSATFDGQTGAALLHGLEDKITHRIDDATVGLVIWKAGTIFVTPAGTATATNNDFTRLSNGITAALSGDTIDVTGTYSWALGDAAASYDASKATSDTQDIRGIKLPDGVNDLTITSSTTPRARFIGNGDYSADYDGFLFSDDSWAANGGPNAVGNNNLTIENLDIEGFESAVMLGWNSTGRFNGTRIRNNDITLAGDNSDTQNIAVYLTAGTDQQVTGNTVTFRADGTRSVGSGARSFGFQNSTTGGAGYDGLVIANNVFQVGAGSTGETVYGIWENGHNDDNSSHIAIANNQFLGRAGDFFDRALVLSSQTDNLSVDANTFTDVDNVFFIDDNHGPSAGDRFSFTNNVLTRVGGPDGVFLRNVATNGTVVGIDWDSSNTIDGFTGARGLNELAVSPTRAVSAATNLDAVTGTGTVALVYVDDNYGTARFADPDGIGTGPALAYGFNAFTAVQSGIDALTTAGTVHVLAGTYAGADASGRAVILSAGASPARVVLGGGLTLDANDTLPIELNGSSPATDYDNFDVTGTVTLNGAKLVLSRGFDPFAGQTFTVIANDGTDAVVGVFKDGLGNDILEGAVVSVRGMPFTISYHGGTGNDVVLTVAQPAAVYVNDNWAEAANTSGGTPGTVEIGDEVSGDGAPAGLVFGYNAFASINTAIAAVQAGGTVNVLSGTYAENVIIGAGKSGLTVLGSNATINPITGTRNPEAVVVPGTNDAGAGAVFTVTADGVTIDGFTIDGDNPALAGGVAVGSADANAANGVDATSVNGLTVANNVIRNLTSNGVHGIASATPVGGNLITANAISNVPLNGPTYYGRGVLIEDNFYASVTDNVISGVRTGVQTNNFSQANPGTAAVIGGNTISYLVRGVFLNLHYGNASAFSITDNTIAAGTGAVAGNGGLQVYSIQGAVSVVVSGNTITGADMGIEVWNSPTTAGITITGGSVVNSTLYGLNLNNHNGSYGDATGTTTVTLDGVSFAGNPVGVRVYDDPANANGSVVRLGLTGATSIDNGATGTTGLLVSGSDASLVGQSVGNAVFAGTSGSYVALLNGAMDNLEVNGTTARFGPTVVTAVTGAAATLAQNFDTEDRITHAVDDASVGFIRVKAATVFVTPSSFTAATITPNIQRGVDAAASGDTVVVAAGAYKNNITVTKPLTLLGANAGNAGSGSRGAESVVVTNGNAIAVFAVTGASNVTIDGFTIDGDDPTLPGVALASGDDANVSYGVRPTGAVTNLVVQNNIIKHVEIGLRGDVASQGNVVTRNWFDSIGHFDFGYAVSLRNNFYADVTENLMTRVWTGVHVNNHNGAGGPASWSVSGNEIHSYAGGLLYWLQFNGATGLTIDNNDFIAEAGAVADNFGVLMVSIQNAVNPTFTNNTVVGADYGIGLFNVPTTSTIILGATNSVSGAVKAGVFLTNNLNFNPIGTTNFLAGGPGAASTVVVSGMPISTGANGVGVKVDATGGTATAVNVRGATVVTGTGVATATGAGVELFGAAASATVAGAQITGYATGVNVTGGAATVHATDLSNNSFGVTNTTTNAVDAGGNWWGTASPAAIATRISGSGAVLVNYNPWLTAGDGNVALAGFQADYTQLAAFGTDEDTAIAPVSPPISALGTVTSTLPITTAQGASVTAAGGYFAYDATGSLVIQSLPQGTQLGDSFTYTFSDANGPHTATVTLTVTGVNDAPTLPVAPATVTFTTTTEDTPSAALTVTAILAAAGYGDVDAGAARGLAVTAAPASNGSWQYSTDGVTWVNFGAVGESAALLLDAATQVRYAPDTFNGGTATFGFRAWDQTTGAASTNVAPAHGDASTNGGSTAYSANAGSATIVVTQVDDAPVLTVSPTGAVTEDASTPDLTATGSVTYTDADLGDTDLVTNAFVSAVWSGGTLSPAQELALRSGFTAASTGGSGSWTYTVSNAAVQFLAAGEIVTLTYTVTVTDSESASDTKTVVITVTGVNDEPAITVGSGDSASAGMIESNAGLSASGTLTAVDADQSDTVATSVVSVSVSGVTAGLMPTPATLLAMLSVAPASISANTGDANNLAWAFDSGSEVFDYLAASEQLVLTYTVRVADGLGAFDDQTITITVTGTNDAPVISVGAGDSAAAALVEANAGLSASGTLTAVDADQSDTVTASKVSVVATGAVTGLLSSNSALLAMLTLPTGPLLATTGHVNNLAWAFDSGAEAFDYLQDGATLTLTYTVRVTDGQGAFDDQTITITVTGANDAPILTVAPTGTTPVFTEGSATPTIVLAAGDMVSLTDVDAGDHVYGATVSISAGTSVAGDSLAVAGALPAGITASAYAPATRSLTLTAAGGVSQTDMIAALRLIGFHSTSLNPTAGGARPSRTVEFVVRDGGPTNSESGLATRVVNVVEVNQAPTVTVPGAILTTAEDTPLAFTGANLVTVADPDANPNQVLILLSVTHGTLALGGTSGLTFLAGGGTPSGSMAFTGTLADVNAALAGLTFTPAANYNGVATLAITIDDQGNSGPGGALQDSASVSIVVTSVAEDPIAGDDTFTTNEDTTLVLPAANGLLANDTDPDQTGSLVVSAVGSTPVAPTGETTVVLSGGTLLVRADGAFSFVPAGNFAGTVTFAYTATNADGRTGTGSVTIAVTAVNDAPTVTAPSTLTVAEDAPATAVTGISVADVDAGPLAVTVTLSVTHGRIALNGAVTGVTVGGTPTSRTLTGSLSDINTFLAGTSAVSYTPDADYNGSDSLVVSVNDGGNTGPGGALTGAATVAVTVTAVDDAPTLTAGPGNTTFTEDGSAVVVDAGLTVADIDSPSLYGASVAITAGFVAGEDVLAVPAASLPVGVIASYNPTTGVLTLSGAASPAAYGAALRAVTYSNTSQNPSGANRTVEFVVTDGQLASASATPSTVAVAPVNDAPVAVADSFTTAEDTPVSGSVLANDSDVDSTTLTVAIVGATPSGLVLNPNGSFTYTPPADFNGTVTFQYKPNDGALDGNTVTVTLVVTAVNDAPVAAGDSYDTAEDTTLTVPAAGVLGNDTDVEGSSLSAVLVSAPSHGSLTLNADGSFTYAPAANYNGPDSFQYKANDGELDSNVIIVSFTVTAVNDAPTLDPIAPVAVAEDSGDHTVFLAGISAGPANESGQTLTITATSSDPAVVPNPSVSYAGGASTGTLTFTPAANASGTATITVTVADSGPGTGGNVNTLVRTFTITVTAVNDAPAIGAPTSVAATEDAVATVTGLSFADVDADAAPVAVTLSVGNGTLTLDTGVTGGVTAGQISGNGTGTVTVTAPLAAINTTLAATSGLTYLAAANYHGPDALAVTISDLGNAGSGGPLTATKTVAITVASVNDAPAGTDTTVTTPEDTAFVFAATDFGFTDANDSPANQFAAVVVVTLPAAGSLRLNGSAVTAGQSVSVIDIAAGRLQYLPAANANGAAYANFTFQVRDDGGTADGGVDLAASANTITVTVTAVDDAPVVAVVGAGPLPYTENAPPTPVDGTLTVTEVDGDALVGAVVTLVGYVPGQDVLAFTPVGTITGSFNTSTGVLTLGGSGTAAEYEAALRSVTYFNTSENPSATPRTVTVVVADGTLSSSPASRAIVVTPVNDAPVAVDDSYTTAEDTALIGIVVANDTDVDGGVPGAVLVDAPDHGALTLSPNGLFVYTPAANYNGPDSFSYRAFDGSTLGNVATVLLTVTPVNDAPVAVSDGITTAEDTPVTAAVQANDTDVDGDTLSVVAVTPPAHGTVTFTPAGVTYTPAPDFFGLDTFTYTVSDGNGGTATASVTVTVTPVNNAPVVSVSPVPLSYTENAGPLVVDGTLTVSDSDGTTLTGATVTITGYVAGQDVLAFTAIGAITGSFSTATGVLTLTGTDTLANYEAALRTVTYSNTSDDPLPAARTVRFAVTDGSDTSLPGARPVSIEPVNDAPSVAAPAAATVFEDTDLSVFGVSVSDVDAQVGNLLVTLAVTRGTLTFATGVPGGVTAGQVSGNGTGSVTITAPQAAINATLAAATGLRYRGLTDFYGADTLTLTVNDQGNTGTGGALTTSRIVALTVTSVNDAPHGTSTTVTTSEDTAFVFAASNFGLADAADTPANGLAGVVVTTLPTAGSLRLNGTPVAAGQEVSAVDIAAGRLRFTPAANATGAAYASFTFQVRDDGGTADGGVDLDPTPRTVTIDVAAVNDPPVAVADTATVAEDAVGTPIAVLSNDTDVENDTLAVTAVTQPANGSVSFTPAGVTYTPNPNFHGVDTFTYTISDGNGGTATAGVSVTVTSVNDAPVAVADAATTVEDTPVMINVRANDTDADGDTLAISAVTQPAAGAVTTDGLTVRYTPPANYNGTVTFTYTVTDGNGGSATATVTVTVTPVNDPPLPADDGYDLQAAKLTVPAASGVLANDTDVEPGALRVVSFGQPGHGSVVVNPDGSFEYTPAVGYYGADAFTYTAADAQGATATAVVRVNVSYGQPRSNLLGSTRYSVAAGSGGAPVVNTYIGLSPTPVSVRVVGDPASTTGLRTATGDVTGDGVPDLVTVNGPGAASVVNVYDGATGQLVTSFAAFEAAFTGGSFVTLGDFNRDRVDDIVITPDVGGGPRVTIFDVRNGGVLANFFGISDSNFRGGARAAAGDLNGDTYVDLVVSAGVGGGPRLAGFDGRTIGGNGTPAKLFNDFFAFDPSLRNGVYPAVGDVDGDGKADLIAGAGPGGAPNVRIFSGHSLTADGSQVLVANFFTGDTSNRGGVRVGVADLDGDNKAELVTGTGAGAGSKVRVYLGNTLASGNPAVAQEFDPFGDLPDGIYVD